MQDPQRMGKMDEIYEGWESYFAGRISRRQFLILALRAGGVAAIHALLAACGASPAATPTPRPSSGTPTAVLKPSETATLAPALEPRVLIYAGGQDIPTVDPSDRTDYSIGAVTRQLYDRLFRFEGGWPQPVESGLCVRFEGSEDAREWVFYLTDKAKFHDGTPVTAEAVKFSYERTLRMQKQRANVLLPYLDEKGSIQVIDPYTVRMVLKTPYADFPRLLAYQEQGIMNPKVVQDKGDEWLMTHDAGSGPFTIKSWNPGTAYEFEAIPDYWQGWPGEGRLAGFIWRIIRESATRRVALQAGEVDVSDVISVDDLEILQKDPRIVVHENYGLLAGYIKLNNQKDPTSNPDFRKFLAYAFDYQALVDVLKGHARLMVGPIPEGVPGHDPNVQPLYRHDPQKAREHLAQTPWKDGGIELDYVYVTGLDFEEQIGLILQDQLRQFNIKVNLIPKVWPDMVASCAKPDTGPNMIMIFVQSAPLPDLWFAEQWYSPNWDRPTGGSFQTCDFYKNPEVDQLIEKVRVTLNESERLAIIRELQRIIMEEIPGIPLYVMPNILAMRKRVQGYVYFGDISVDFWRLWIDPSKEA